MLKNNNTKILRKITVRSLRFGKMRNIFIIITVALSAALISGLAGFSAAYDKNVERELAMQYQTMYSELSKEQAESLKDDGRTEDMVTYKAGSPMEVDNYIIRAAYYSEDGGIIKSARSQITEGTYPAKINEAAVSKAYMRKISKEPVIGAEITITWLDGNTETYTVTGYTDAEPENNFVIMLSEEYAESGAELKDVNYTAALRINGADKMTEQTFLEEIRSMGGQYGIPRYNIRENSSFVVMISDTTPTEKITVIIVSIAVLFISVFVIYSIFYISVTGRIRQFGQLRTIGMTSKQIRKTVQYEGIFLSAAGIMAGICIGTACAYFLMPSGFYLPNTLNIWALTIIANTLTVMLSIRKPAKIAAAVSPIEAAKMYDNRAETKNKAGRKRSLTPFNLAKISAGSNRKKSAMTAISLGIGGVLFILGGTFLAAYNLEEYARQAEFSLGDYMIGISNNAIQTAEYGLTDIQLVSPFTKELEAEIASLDGVEKITRQESFEVTYEYNNYQSNCSIMSFNKKDVDMLEPHIQDYIDYEKMIQNKEILVNNNSVAKEIFGWEFEIGDKVKFRWYDGTDYREDYFTIAGNMENLYKVTDEKARLMTLNDGWFFLPEELLAVMVPEGYNFSYRMIIAVEDYKTDTVVKEFLENYTDDNLYLTLAKFTAYLKQREKDYNSMKYMIWGLSAFIIGFALINMINTLVSNAMARKGEFAMLCSIGMSRAQLKKMIIEEGLILAVKNIIITVCLGVPAGYAFILLMHEFGAYYLHWHFPIWHLLAYAVLVVLVPVIISGVVICILGRKPLVERLREVE
ncbi:MAG: FtsX-like permease family protein [Butyrivibrio sp.]|nr:FtsX-like permease family protein [Butyrivibrio sp.]